MLEMAANDPMEHVQLTIQDMPEVERAAKCALPIIFTSLDHPEYPGVHGTCTALRFGADSIFVTAAHVVANSDDRTMVEVALGFRGDPLRARVREILKPHPTEEQHEAVCDFAVMFPVSPPAFVAGDSDAYDLARVAKMDAAPRKSLFGVFGYPRSYEDRNIVDYAAGTVTFGLHLAVGTHEGPSSIKGHHTLDVSTAEIGGPNGFSGGPVFRLLFDKASGAWTPAFAGIVTMGGPKRIQFIDIAFLGKFLRGVSWHASGRRVTRASRAIRTRCMSQGWTGTRSSDEKIGGGGGNRRDADRIRVLPSTRSSRPLSARSPRLVAPPGDLPAGPRGQARRRRDRRLVPRFGPEQLRTRPATSPGSSCSSTAAWRRSDI